ncbi:MAG: pyruvate kinase [Candidatus Altiarchaeota archaeon]
MKKTKILCTIGPASIDKSILEKMFKAGMDAVRINTAFNSPPFYRKIVRNVRATADIPILIDVKGPEIRFKVSSDIKVERNSTVSIGFKPGPKPYFNRNIFSKLKVGDTIIFDKGKYSSRIVGRERGLIKVKFNSACLLKNGMGVNVPGRRLDVSTLSKEDLAVIRLAKELDLDYVALSFTRNVEDIKKLKRHLNGTGIGLIAKIENHEGVENVDAIMRSCDGVMIARGDLGVEIPSERIPMIQKDLIGKCNRLGKISIVATEMLQSMVESSQPTRAETSDVANAILDGADAIMLSAESAVGKYPLESVKTMAKIALEVETHMPIKPLDEEAHEKISLAISKAVTSIIDTVDVDKIVVATRTGYTAMLISNFRICKDIIAITNDPKVRRKLHLVYAIQPVEHAYFKKKEKILEIAKYCLKEGLIKKTDLVLFTAGIYTTTPTTNLIEIQKIKDLIEYDKRKNGR